MYTYIKKGTHRLPVFWDVGVRVCFTVYDAVAVYNLRHSHF